MAKDEHRAATLEQDAGTPRLKPTGGRVLSRIRAHLPALGPSDARVAQAVLADPRLIIYRSATEVGDVASTSSATVVRCAQKLGFKGFHDLKLALAQDLAALEDAPADDAVGGSPGVLERVTRLGAESVRDAGALVTSEVFDAAVSALTSSDRLLFVGVGTSAPLCQDAAYRFSVIGCAGQAPADVHVQHVQARLLRPGDVCVVVSHSGATRETLAAARAAQAAGATTIALTSFARSELTEHVDIAIVAGTRELSFHLEAMASRLAHLALLDALLVAVADVRGPEAQAALAVYTDVLSEHRL